DTDASLPGPSRQDADRDRHLVRLEGGEQIGERADLRRPLRRRRRRRMRGGKVGEAGHAPTFARASATASAPPSARCGGRTSWPPGGRRRGGREGTAAGPTGAAG